MQSNGVIGTCVAWEQGWVDRSVGLGRVETIVTTSSWRAWVIRSGSMTCTIKTKGLLFWVRSTYRLEKFVSTWADRAKPISDTRHINPIPIPASDCIPFRCHSFLPKLLSSTRHRSTPTSHQRKTQGSCCFFADTTNCQSFVANTNIVLVLTCSFPSSFGLRPIAGRQCWYGTPTGDPSYHSPA